MKSRQHLSKSKKVPAAVPYLTLDLCIAGLVAVGTAYSPVIGLGCFKRCDSRRHLTKPADLWRAGRADSTRQVSFGWRRKPAAALPPDIYPVRWVRFAAVFTAATVSCHFAFSARWQWRVLPTVDVSQTLHWHSTYKAARDRTK